jgi:hypothetical protein
MMLTHTHELKNVLEPGFREASERNSSAAIRHLVCDAQKSYRKSLQVNELRWMDSQP